MTILDYIFLLLTGLLSAYLVWKLTRKTNCKESSCPYHYYFAVAFLVMLVAGLILIFAGWDALATDFVSVVAGVIPFSLATGLVARYYPSAHKPYLGLMVLGLLSIAVVKFGGFDDLSRVIYPIFHGIAGLTIFFIPIMVIRTKRAPGGFIYFSIGGALIGLGGMALAFLSAGKQLLFFSGDVVIAILAPLLFLTTLGFAMGIKALGKAETTD